jgi:hypothetical protein
MAITTQAKVEAVLNRILTSAEEGFLPERLAMAESDILDAFPGLALAETVVEDEANEVRADFDVWTNRYPIVSVEALAVNGAAVDLTDLVITDGFAPLVLPSSPFSMTYKDVGGWRAGDRVVISYTAGFPDPDEEDGEPGWPPHVSNVAAEMIAVRFATPLAVGQETLGDHSVAYRGSPAFAPEALRKRLRTLARRVTSLPMLRV